MHIFLVPRLPGPMPQESLRRSYRATRIAVPRARVVLQAATQGAGASGDGLQGSNHWVS